MNSLAKFAGFLVILCVASADNPPRAQSLPPARLAKQDEGTLNLRGADNRICVSIDLKTGATIVRLGCDAGGAKITSVTVEDDK